MSTAMNFSSKSFQPRPPDKGSFPLDHFGKVNVTELADSKFCKCDKVIYPVMPTSYNLPLLCTFSVCLSLFLECSIHGMNILALGNLYKTWKQPKF